MDDSTQVLNQDTVAIPVLLNDYDPDGDSLIISSVYSCSHGDCWHTDSMVYFTSEWFEGREGLKYRIEKKNAPGYVSDYAYIYIDVLYNPEVPVATDDSLHARFLEPTELHLLENDTSPGGHELIIWRISSEHNCSLEIASDSSHVILTSTYGGSSGKAWFDYEVKERSGTNYISNEAEVTVYLDPNPELPVAADDSYSATGGITAVLDVLDNDLNPLGDTLVITITSYPGNGSLELIDDLLYYTANTSYTGYDALVYKIHYKNNPAMYSELARVTIYVSKNPDCPYGEADYGSGLAYSPIAVEVLSNDHDPNGEAIKIKDVNNPNYPYGKISYSSDTVYYWTPATTSGYDTAYYRICKVNDTNYFSEWIPVVVEVEQNPAYGIAMPDSASTKAGIPVSIHFRENDILPDSIIINNVAIYGASKGMKTNQSDSVLTYTPFSNSFGRDTLNYVLANFGNPPHIFAEGEIYIDIKNNHSYDSLNINNINAGINASGMQFARIEEIPEYGISEFIPHFEAPKGSGKHTMFANTLWIGGIDDSQMLHIAAERFRGYGWEYQPGPIANTYDTAYFSKWNTTWKLTREEVSYHYRNWWKEGYEPIRSIAEWPGNGDQNNGMAEQLAPYHDENGDGFYDPMDGDFPLIRGDQCILFFTNDDRIHGTTQAQKMQVEIQGMAYAYDAPEDSILNNTVFVHYSLTNRSDQSYYNTYFGIFTDLDLGYAWDDYIGSHVEGSSYYVYNGLETDGQGEPGTYGDYPPAQSVTFLAGPFMDADMEDNADGGCDFSVNGLNFGNGIVDDERYGMTRFTFFNNGPTGDPAIGNEYYNYMKGIWKDNTPVLFGGNGHLYNGAEGPECRFMFPGDTDPLNWGTDCEYPAGGWNQNGLYWTEETSNNNPYDRRGIGACGPFTFKPGDVQEVDMAYVFANSYFSADSSRDLLKERLYELRLRTLNGSIIVPNSELDIREAALQQESIRMYPNPANQWLYVEIIEHRNEETGRAGAEYQIANVMGKKLMSGRLTGKSTGINISNLTQGIYIVTVHTERGNLNGKFMKY